MQAPKAMLWSALGGYLLLPSVFGIDLPGVPDLDKIVAVDLAAIYALVRYPWKGKKPEGEKLYLLLTLVLIVAPFFTAYTNKDVLSFGPESINGLTYYDGLSMAVAKALMIAPFWAGRRLLGNEAGHLLILKGLLAATLVYSIFVVFEIRFSPQLHGWVYGYKPFTALQQARYGGFRAVVFLNQGLQIALLLGQAIIAAIVLRRNPGRVLGLPYGLAIAGLIGVLLYQKSLGAIILTSFFGILLLFLPPRRQLFITSLAALFLVSYPAVRTQELAVLDYVTSLSGAIDPSRQQSFQFRLKNETMLLERGQERPYFGWGGWNRNQPHDERRGRVISVLDGAWIIIFSENGWVGYLALFGMLCLPLIMLSRARKRMGPISPYTAGLAVLLALNLLDLIPNYSMSPVTWMIAGALSSLGIRKRKPAEPAPSGPAPTDPELKPAGSSTPVPEAA